MSNVIVRAKDEVFLATNYWQNSVASKYITEAIRELDRRAGKRGARVVVKILYDRGSPRQLYQPHYIVREKVSTGKDVNLPSANEIPNIDLEVMNYHTPLLGTFHAKYVVVDRKIALLQSNNIQDNDNLEMMVHLEGPIVDSVYDMALISWHKRLDPPLPSQTAASASDGGQWSGSDTGTKGGSMADLSSEMGKMQPIRGNKKPISVPELHQEEESNGAVTVPPSRDSAQQLGPLPEHTADDPHYDDDIAGEVARAQASLALKPGETHLQAVTRLLNHTLNEGLPGDPGAPECPPGEFMTPYLPHQTHTPYPMALVNRAPYGPPTHKSVSNPQNAAWLSALRNAQKSVHIISPTLNASPIIPAIIEACERGVDVYCYICLSYNDAVSSHPFTSLSQPSTPFTDQPPY
jgi:phosphatidylserine/phosphatidylglycerophosphate/cardiolipin synthase-like enzyme